MPLFMGRGEVVRQLPPLVASQFRVKESLAGYWIIEGTEERALEIVATLARRHGQFDACEGTTQEAVLAALSQWSDRGIWSPRILECRDR